MNTEKLEPNLFAQNIRHKRVFLKTLFFSRTFFRLMLDVKAFWKAFSARIFGRRSSATLLVERPVVVKDPFTRLFRQVLAIGGALLVMSLFATHGAAETGFTAEYIGNDSDFTDETDQQADLPFLMNDEGFVLKPSPATEEVSRIGFTDSVKHTVVSGDNLSTIASLYGISTKTLVWENSISENGTLNIGQTLVIPPVDGVSYKVTSAGETLSGIAKKYSVDTKLIKEHNNLANDTITKGQKLFIPGGKKKEEPKQIFVARAGNRGGGRVFAANTFDTKVVMGSNGSPSVGKELLFPTNGRITQGFRGGHYANDIGNTSRPDVWSAADGTAVIAKGGCPARDEKVERGCNGGYGNYVVIDHGDSLQTIYAHLETIYVTEGQKIDRGQALGKMGNSGRVYGPTGIHLHFEVIDGGVKRNPANYM